MTTATSVTPAAAVGPADLEPACDACGHPAREVDLAGRCITPVVYKGGFRPCSCLALAPVPS